MSYFAHYADFKKKPMGGVYDIICRCFDQYDLLFCDIKNEERDKYKKLGVIIFGKISKNLHEFESNQITLRKFLNNMIRDTKAVYNAYCDATIHDTMVIKITRNLLSASYTLNGIADKKSLDLTFESLKYKLY